MIKCQTCGRENFDGAQYCDQCGVKLFPANDNNNGTPQFEPPVAESPVYSETPTYQKPPVISATPAYQEFPVEQAIPAYQRPPANQEAPVYQQSSVNQDTPAYQAPPVNSEIPAYPEPTAYPESPVFSGASVTSVGIPPIVEALKEPAPPVSEPEIRAENKGVHAVLTIERGSNIGKEFALSAGESYLGRWDADNGVFPDVDLDAHDPEAKISRRHARILFHQGKYQLEDLGSTNGTYINRGRRLIPGTPQPLNDGDELIVGKTFLRFRIAN